jgi:RNA polymerase sigma factor (TIGR02999 family)
MGLAGDTLSFENVYEALRAIAHRHLSGSGHTLNTTALVHEAWLKLSRGEASLEERHFLALAATAMRQIVIDHARRHQAHTRAHGTRLLADLDEVGRDSEIEELLAIDQLLTRLASLDERLSRVVLFRFFGGLREEEIASVLDVDVRTVRRDWRKARAFIVSELARP